MQLEYRIFEQLPRLAWCAVARRGSPTVEVRHGPSIELRDGWFCEGAWAGDFGAGEFAYFTLMGSGGLARESDVLFAAPHHTLERLHSLQRPPTTFMSNSLAFLLAVAGEELDPEYPYYRRDLRTITEGLSRYVRTLPTRAGNSVRLHYHCNVALDEDGVLREEPKPAAPEFRDFSDYREFLQSTVQALCRNAADARRCVTYRPVATISTGYDSPATAVLARAAGCRDALTFRLGREVGKTDWQTTADSGALIAAHLDMRVKEYQRTDYLRAAGLPEAELLASGPMTLDATMLAWEPDLGRSMLFTGFHGDKVWDVHNHNVSREIIRGDASGASLGEFRLRVGFIHVPVPFIGCMSHPFIHRISQSEEMKRWRLATDYDRPIPRRIVEEAGVPRELFGHTKKAATVPMFGPELKGRELSALAFADFNRYYRRHRTLVHRTVAAMIMGSYGLYLKSAKAANFVLRRLDAKPRLPYHSPMPLSPRVRYNKRLLARAGLLNQWAIEKIKDRYRPGVEADRLHS